MPTIAALIAKHLKNMGIEYAFGIPGKPVVPLILEMEEQGIHFGLSRHECGAGYIATGYAMQNKTLGVAIGTSGPGGTNMLTAAAQAKAYHAPVLFITGQPPTTENGKALGQDSSMFGTDLVEMFRPVTLFSARVEDPRTIQSYLQHALEKSLTGQKGPVHLSIPLNVLTSETMPHQFPEFQLEDIPVSGNIHQALDIINKAKKPLLYLGKGIHIANAYEEVVTFAETWNIPVMTTPGGKGTFPTQHPLSLGSFGLGGTEASSSYLSSGIDLLIVIGSKLSDMSLAGFSPDLYPKHVIHFDMNSTFVGKSIPVKTTLVQGDAKRNLQELLQYKQHAAVKTVDLSIHKQKDLENFDGQTESGPRLSAAKVMGELRELLPEETVMYGDDGSHTFYAIKYYDIIKQGTFFFDDVFGAMGHGIGFSIGAKLANPNIPVVCLTGDGCLFMHGTEISTAVDLKANVLFIVLNNGMLDMVDKGMLYNIGKTAGTRYDFELNAKEFARSMGANGYRCSTINELREAVSKGLSEDDPTVIEVMVNKDEIPPTMKRG
ncbi:thiamine pyrophosphate-binding protein [Bacillus gobiensis]|uniref:thiamine pyrophosphate-binding protein n=1 Tax=Bacillus gobiensis TaxID=1441095 RepID=UPI003D198B72